MSSSELQAPEKDEIVDEIFEDYCAIPMGSNEDYWSDFVIFPCLRLARKWSRLRSLNVIPV